MHLSGFSDPNLAYKDYEREAATPGKHILNPHWKIDYTEQCALYVESLKSAV
jgi:hypothetical protein